MSVLLFFCWGLLLTQNAHAQETPEYAILIVGDKTNPQACVFEEQFIRSLGSTWGKKAPVRIYSYHMDIDRERQYCEKKLGIADEDVPTVGIVEVQDRVPRNFALRLSHPSNAETAAREVVGQTDKLLATSRASVGSATADPSYPAGVRITSRETGYTISLHPEADKSGSGAYLMAMPDQQARYQRWYLQPAGSGNYHIRSAFSGLYVNSDRDGERIVQSNSAGAPWTLVRQTDGSVEIRNTNTGKVWDESGALGDRGSDVKPLLLYGENGGANQHFLIQNDGLFAFGSTANSAEVSADRRAVEERRRERERLAAQQREKAAREYQLRAIGTWKRDNFRLTIKSDRNYLLFDDQGALPGAWDINEEGKIILYGADRRNQRDMTIESIDGSRAYIGGYAWER